MDKLWKTAAFQEIANLHDTSSACEQCKYPMEGGVMPHRSETSTVDALDEISRLLALLLRRQDGEQPLQEFIGDLSSAGLAPSRIAELAGTTPGYVSVALSRTRKKASPPK